MIKTTIKKLLKLWAIALVTIIIGLWPIGIAIYIYTLYIGIKLIIEIAGKADEKFKTDEK